jgi:hypothetical protein
MNEYKLRPDGSLPAEDDSRLRRPADELVDDPDTAHDPDVDQRAEPETPALDEAEPEDRK